MHPKRCSLKVWCLTYWHIQYLFVYVVSWERMADHTDILTLTSLLLYQVSSLLRWAEGLSLEDMVDCSAWKQELECDTSVVPKHMFTHKCEEGWQDSPTPSKSIPQQQNTTSVCCDPFHDRTKPTRKRTPPPCIPKYLCTAKCSIPVKLPCPDEPGAHKHLANCKVS